jgi:hypothetical protein
MRGSTASHGRHSERVPMIEGLPSVVVTAQRVRFLVPGPDGNADGNRTRCRCTSVADFGPLSHARTYTDSKCPPLNPRVRPRWARTRQELPS